MKTIILALLLGLVGVAVPLSADAYRPSSDHRKRAYAELYLGPALVADLTSDFRPGVGAGMTFGFGFNLTREFGFGLGASGGRMVQSFDWPPTVTVASGFVDLVYTPEVDQVETYGFVGGGILADTSQGGDLADHSHRRRDRLLDHRGTQLTRMVDGTGGRGTRRLLAFFRLAGRANSAASRRLRGSVLQTPVSIYGPPDPSGHVSNFVPVGAS